MAIQKLVIHQPDTGEDENGHFDLARLLASREAERYDLYGQHLNHQDGARAGEPSASTPASCAGAARISGSASGARYLDLVSGWGVFAIGRNHPHVAAALKSVLDADLPNLVQMDVSPLAGALAERLLARAPWLQKAFFRQFRRGSRRGVHKVAALRDGARGCRAIASIPFHRV